MRHLNSHINKQNNVYARKPSKSTLFCNISQLKGINSNCAKQKIFIVYVASTAPLRIRSLLLATYSNAWWNHQHANSIWCPFVQSMLTGRCPAVLSHCPIVFCNASTSHCISLQHGRQDGMWRTAAPCKLFYFNFYVFVVFLISSTIYCCFFHWHCITLWWLAGFPFYNAFHAIVAVVSSMRWQQTFQ